MGRKPEPTMPETLLAIEKSGPVPTTHEGHVDYQFDFKLSAEALAEIKLLERCSILAEHRLGEFRVG